MGFYLRKKETGHAGGRAGLGWARIWPCWARWAGLGVVLGVLGALAGLGVVLGVGFGCAGRAGVGFGRAGRAALGWAWGWASAVTVFSSSNAINKQTTQNTELKGKERPIMNSKS